MKRKEKTILISILLISLLIRMCFLLAIPAWQSPDEYPHYWFIEQIARHHHLPDSAPGFPSYEAFQPPLYYIISSFIAKICPGALSFSAQPSHPPAEVIILRLLSVLAGVSIIYFSYRIYGNIPNIRPSDRLLGITFLSMLPTFIGVTSTINNDAFVVLFSSISLMYLLKPVWTDRIAICSGLWAGVALLTKISAWTLLPVLVFRVLQFKSEQKNPVIRWLLLAVSAWTCGAILLAVRNIVQFDSVLVLNPGVPAEFHFSFPRLIWSIRNLAWSFFLAFGRIYQLRPPAIIYLATITPLLLSAAWGWTRAIRVHSKLFQLIAVSAVLGIFSSLYYTFSFAPGTMTSWGKNLYPILPLVVIFFVIGWNSVCKKRRTMISMVAIVIMAIGCAWALEQFQKMFV